MRVRCHYDKMPGSVQRTVQREEAVAGWQAAGLGEDAERLVAR